MPGQLRQRQNGHDSPPSHGSPPQDLRTPRHPGGESSALDEWKRNRALKLKTSPPRNSSISSSIHDSNCHEHHYLTPCKLSPSQITPPPPQYVDAHHGKVSLKSALFIFIIIITSSTVGMLINWKDGSFYEGHPRCVAFETMPRNSSPTVNQHFRTLWSSNFEHSLPPFTHENEEDLAEMDKTGQSVNGNGQPVRKVTGNTENCDPKASWQTTSYPTCNNLHEIDFVHSVGRNIRSHIFAERHTGRRVVTAYTPKNNPIKSEVDVDIELKGQGWFRAAWAVHRKMNHDEWDDDDDDEYRRDEQVIVKTLRIERDFTEEFYELHRRDAMAMERLTQSPHVLDIYGYCGQSTTNELASQGIFHKMVKRGEHKKKRLSLAYDVAKGVSDVHSIDYADFVAPSDGSGVSPKRSNATMVHYDLNLHNIAVVEDRYLKLNDFNVAMFLGWDPKKKATCGFGGRFREPWWRSPEEMQNHEISLTEKVDVYSLGNILWTLLTNKPPWSKNKDSEVVDALRQRVAKGEMPPLPSKIVNSTDLSIVAIRNAMFKCLRLDPEERASAGEVAHDLKMAIEEVKRLEKRG